MQPPSKKTGSFNKFLDTVRQSSNVGPDVEGPQLRILAELNRGGTVTLGELVKTSGLDPLKGYELVKQLVEANLVAKVTGDEDAPAFSLTPAGKNMVHALVAS